MLRINFIYFHTWSLDMLDLWKPFAFNALITNSIAGLIEFPAYFYAIGGNGSTRKEVGLEYIFSLNGLAGACSM